MASFPQKTNRLNVYVCCSRFMQFLGSVVPLTIFWFFLRLASHLSLKHKQAKWWSRSLRKGHFRRFDCIQLIIFCVPLKKTKVLNQKYSLKIEISFCEKKLCNQANLGITESAGSSANRDGAYPDKPNPLCIWIPIFKKSSSYDTFFWPPLKNF